MVQIDIVQMGTKGGGPQSTDTPYYLRGRGGSPFRMSIRSLGDVKLPQTAWGRGGGEGLARNYGDKKEEKRRGGGGSVTDTVQFSRPPPPPPPPHFSRTHTYTQTSSQCLQN